MAYVFDGYSEASSARNSPRNQRQPLTGSRQRRREQDGPTGSGGGSEGVYFGTGRFYEENLRNEQQRQREREREQQQQQQQQQQQTPRYPSSGPFGGLNGSGFSTGSDWPTDEWGQVFVEVLRRTQRRQQGMGDDGGLGMGFGGGAMGGGLGQQAPRAGEDIHFEDFFGGTWGSTEGGRRGGGGRGRFGADAGWFGFGGASRGGTSFGEMFGPSDHSPGGAGYGAGAGCSFGFGDREYVRRGGAGMTWAEFMELFRHRYDGDSPYGCAGGPPPVDLFDNWHTDW
ncbi:uncharacterized protein ColSpa_02761 [Colletotrichum spaethianum]|uniref:Uncharacterized protein n=1 Tax=Colletotrichum spaethianum TaxID=700344 RepID=A0AA37LAU0_9PEZI|nr:uncharacterized protein ColSpa_02761 [Colletotrichum spaethianum]GKT42580.1 hypothetical protein ColSpa_02761 [Colletotrichum spaethianum]